VITKRPAPEPSRLDQEVTNPARDSRCFIRARARIRQLFRHERDATLLVTTPREGS
jgi:hypothetical protein